jgi:hypothetical protein
MSRVGFFLSGMFVLVLVLGPTVAHAQPVPEASPQACHDGYDNDGNGYVDCNDPNCAQFCQPPPGYAPPPPGYQPPPPGYQQPPPGYQPPPPGYQQPPGYYVQPQPVYVMPPPAPRPPGTGIGAIVAGFILLPLGLIFLAVGGSLISKACDRSLNCGSDFPGTSAYDDYWSGVVLVIFGVPMAIAGLVLIPVGFARYGRYSRWKREHGMAFYHKGNLTLEPVMGMAASMTAMRPVSTLGQSGTLGLKLTW